MNANEGNRPRIKPNAVRVTTLPTQQQDNKERDIDTLIRDKKREIRRLEKTQARKNGQISIYDKSGTLEATGRYNIVKRKFFPDREPVIRIKNYDNLQDAINNMDVMTRTLLNRGHFAWCEIPSVIGKNRLKSFTAINPTNGKIIDIFIQDIDKPYTTSITDIFKEIRRNIADINECEAIPILKKYWPEALKDRRTNSENSWDRIYDENPIGHIAWYNDEKSTAHMMRENIIRLNEGQLRQLVENATKTVLRELHYD